MFNITSVYIHVRQKKYRSEVDGFCNTYFKKNVSIKLSLISYLFQSEISKKAISDIKRHLLTRLKNFSKIKDEKQLMADLWCHFGKAFFSSIDEGNNTWSRVMFY